MDWSKPEIIPTIMEERIEDVAFKLERVAAKVERIQIDILDGSMSDNLTISLMDLLDVDVEGLALDIQLMTQYPVEYLGDCHSIGVDRVFGQIERMGSQTDFVETALDLGIKPGIALALHTPVASMDELLLPKLDGILLLAVQIGHSGDKFSDLVIPKIKKLRSLGFAGDIQIDGGMEPLSVCACFQAGANQFAMNSFLWKAENLDRALHVECKLE